MGLLDLPPPPAPRADAKRARNLRDYEWSGAIPFLAVHVLVAGAFFTGVTVADVACCLALYGIRMFAVTGGYHRYFSHRTFKTSRVFQFLLAFLAQTSAQRGVLWWAAHHRDHHKYSDTGQDPHSPVRFGFLYSHLGWLFDHNDKTKYDRVKDLARYPELVILNKLWLLPPIALGVAVWAVLGWSGLFVGFFLSTVLLWHGTFSINSLSHVWGSRRFRTGDDSRNNFWLALLTLGEGWHNNHHHYMGAARQGFYWWEVDVTYYVLRVLAALGLVWDLRPVPERVYAEARPSDRVETGGTP